jgi:N4-gp56 family major capsid protein
MARTIIGVNDPKAVKKWAGLLAMDTSAKSYFNSKMMGRGADAEVPIQILTDLESDAGETISYDLLAELTMAPVEGEDDLEGKEERQRFYTDNIYVDQARCGVNTGGRMTRKRTLHNLREKARRQQSGWWARLFDELLFIYLSGARGSNENYLVPVGYTGRANNALKAPDGEHRIYGFDGTDLPTTSATIEVTDTFDVKILDRAVTRALTQGGGASGVPSMQPCKINGEDTFVCVMHTWQEDDLRSNSATGQWMDIQKAAAASEGRNSPLFKGSLGMYRGVVLHSHKNVVRFNSGVAMGGFVPTTGAAENSLTTTATARALFMGAQAGVVAFGSPGTNLRFDWFEETRDNGDKVVISTSSIFGTKKVTFDTDEAVAAQDFGVFALDTACAAR